MTSRLVRTLALAPVLSLAACAASSSPDVTGATDDEGSHAAIEAHLASPKSAYSFFVVAKAGRGFALTRLNGVPMRCATGGYDDTCPLAAIDLSATGLSTSDAQSVIDGLGHDPRRSTVILLGNVTTGTNASGDAARSSTLHVQEIWRAPSARPIDGDVIHVSHATSQALWVNDWSGVHVASLAFAGAPKVETCALENGVGTCTQSYDQARLAAASATGLLVVGGVRRDGSVVASQYFLRVSIGDHHSSDGSAFCKATQTACDSGSCFEDPVLCHVQTGTGRGQLQTVRFDVPLFRTWLLATSQTVTSDYPTP
jgi:hypothetical protein